MSKHRSGIYCPECSEPKSIVTDSRGNASHSAVRRRRRCPNGHRYTTYEMLDHSENEEQFRHGAVEIITQQRMRITELEKALADKIIRL